jgi:Domain of unknown function (DUF4432)
VRPALELGAPDGLQVRLLPDRALDCGAASFAGVPIAWLSGVGEVEPLDDDFRRWWGGGLVTTCGLRNVGAPSEGHPQHGAIHGRRADLHHHDAVSARATVADGPLELRREWRISTGSIALRDVVTNAGGEAEPAPFLYHVNFGAPLWAPGCTLRVASAGVHPRDADAAAYAGEWDRAPEHRPGEPERVYEHVAPRGEAVVAGAGLEVTIAWTGLGRLHQWTHPGEGALGIEPANCSVLGRARDRAEGRLPVLEPGEARETTLVIRTRRA